MILTIEKLEELEPAVLSLLRTRMDAKPADLGQMTDTIFKLKAGTFTINEIIKLMKAVDIHMYVNIRIGSLKWQERVRWLIVWLNLEKEENI